MLGSSLDLWEIIEFKDMSSGALNIQWMSVDYCFTEHCRSPTMSAVAEVLGTIVEETGRAAAGSHSLMRADQEQMCQKNHSNVDLCSSRSYH